MGVSSFIHIIFENVCIWSESSIGLLVISVLPLIIFCGVDKEVTEVVIIFSVLNTSVRRAVFFGICIRHMAALCFSLCLRQTIQV